MTNTRTESRFDRLFPYISDDLRALRFGIVVKSVACIRYILRLSHRDRLRLR